MPVHDATGRMTLLMERVIPPTVHVSRPFLHFRGITSSLANGAAFFVTQIAAVH